MTIIHYCIPEVCSAQRGGSRKLRVNMFVRKLNDKALPPFITLGNLTSQGNLIKPKRSPHAHSVSSNPVSLD